MNNKMKMVQEFMHAAKQATFSMPTQPGTGTTAMRVGLIMEEATELGVARDLTAAADAIVDLLYVVYGAALNHGLGEVIDDLFKEVHRSNMTKVADDGLIYFRTDGKVLKGPNYEPPKLQDILDEA